MYCFNWRASFNILLVALLVAMLSGGQGLLFKAFKPVYSLVVMYSLQAGYWLAVGCGWFALIAFSIYGGKVSLMKLLHINSLKRN